MVQVKCESGPEKRERLLREYVERRQREDPESWAMHLARCTEEEGEAEEWRREAERERMERMWTGCPIGPIGRDPGLSTGYSVPAHGGLVGQDVFAGERRYVRRGMHRII